MKQEMRIISTSGERLYLTEDERSRFREASMQAKRETKALCLTLLYTGCRISEALGITVRNVDLSDNCIVIRSLKKRKEIHYRSIPVPYEAIETLDNIFGIREKQRLKQKPEPLWTWTRQHATVLVKQVMIKADIVPGSHRCPKGLRHGFGVSAVVKGVPLNMLKKWMGHQSIETTSIYANAIGQEERSIAQKMWN
jgi:integrase